MNQRAIQQAFHDAAGDYDAHASQQRQVLEQLVAYAAPYLKEDALVLDVGAGTGYLKRHTGWNIIASDLAEGMCRIAAGAQPAVVAPMERLPIQSGSVDMVFSSLALQWSEQKDQMMREAFRALKPGGVMALSCYVEGTLRELAEAYQAAGVKPSLQRFTSNARLVSLAKASGFETAVSKSDKLEVEYNSLKELFKYLKLIGAHTRADASRNGLMTPRRLAEIERAYPKAEGQIVSSWQVGYLIAKKPA